MKARGVPSPDRADAAVMSYYEGISTVQNAQAILEAGKTVSEDDLLTMPT